MLLDWVFVLETEYDRGGEPYVFEATLLPSEEMCADLAIAKLEDLKEQPCSYTDGGSGAPVSATGWCYKNPKRQHAKWVARGGEGPPAFGYALPEEYDCAWKLYQQSGRARDAAALTAPSGEQWRESAAQEIEARAKNFRRIMCEQHLVDPLTWPHPDQNVMLAWARAQGMDMAADGVRSNLRTAPDAPTEGEG